MTEFHLHLLSDSTGETLETIATACLAQFEGVDVRRHLWPMVRSEGHLDRVLDDVERRPGLVLYTWSIRHPPRANSRVAARNPCGAWEDVATPFRLLGREAAGSPGSKRARRAYSRRWTRYTYIAHDDGVGWDNWEEADILLAEFGTPRGLEAIYSPIAAQGPNPLRPKARRRDLIPASALVVGLTNADRLIRSAQPACSRAIGAEPISRSRAVDAELAFARGSAQTMDGGVDVTSDRSRRRHCDRQSEPSDTRRRKREGLLASKSDARRQDARAAGVAFETVEDDLDEARRKRARGGGFDAAGSRGAAQRKRFGRGPRYAVLGADQRADDDAPMLSKPNRAPTMMNSSDILPPHALIRPPS